MGGAMTDEMIDLARRAVACEGWRWVPGMLATHPEHKPARALSVQSDEYEPPMLEIAWSWLDGDGVHPRGWLPDLTDPATIGCLLALVREAWDAPQFFPDLTNVGFRVFDGGDFYPTEAAALVAALEAAPC